jgi:transketolase
MSDRIKVDEQVVVDTIRTLSMDAVQRANSGHPGMPMGMADGAAVLWLHHLTTDPSAPEFVDRDRFVLSPGHGSMLLYSLLHLSGHDLQLDELKSFRQLHSRTPGHPEYGMTPGVEVTTGPLGQGFATAVGMAMAERYLAAHFNRPGHTIVDHSVLGICSDGDLEEGISHEAASLAGHLGLGKITFLYDDNNITIDGDAGLSFSEDTTQRFLAYGWHVQDVDGHDRDAIHAALSVATGVMDRPSLIRCRTHIGYGSPNKQDSAASHGAPLGDDEIRLTKEGMGWPVDAQFEVPQAALDAFSRLRDRGQRKRARWEESFEAYRSEHPELAGLWVNIHEGDGLPANLESLLPGFGTSGDEKAATRRSSGAVINALAETLPQLWGGSADLAGSNMTLVAGEPSFQKDCRDGRNLHFGIREHAMAAAMNGMALHGGVIPYGGTFLTFSDYMRGSMRLSALMNQRVVYILTHDSIFLGEDGPTHQSVEHAAALRLIPGMHVMRPADIRETSAAWAAALRRTDGPTCLLLSRQGLPPIPGSRAAMEGVERGGYLVHGDPGATPDLIMIGTGSELHLCVETAVALEAQGHNVRVISMPSVERFRAQDDAYQESLLPPQCPLRLSVEAGTTNGWADIVGTLGFSIGIDTFGESAPASALAEHFGFTTAHVTERAQGMLASFRSDAERRISDLQSALSRAV